MLCYALYIKVLLAYNSIIGADDGYRRHGRDEYGVQTFVDALVEVFPDPRKHVTLDGGESDAVSWIYPPQIALMELVVS